MEHKILNKKKTGVTNLLNWFIAKKLKATNRTIERAIKQLQIKNKIRRTGRDRSGSWKVTG